MLRPELYIDLCRDFIDKAVDSYIEEQNRLASINGITKDEKDNRIWHAKHFRRYAYQGLERVKSAVDYVPPR